jgi:hypothetical protein
LDRGHCHVAETRSSRTTDQNISSWAEEALAETITRADIEAVLLNAQVLEDYPEWWLGPSCLVHGRDAAARDLHVVVSYGALPVTVITVYEPRPPKWITPFRRRSGNK